MDFILTYGCTSSLFLKDFRDLSLSDSTTILLLTLSCGCCVLIWSCPVSPMVNRFLSMGDLALIPKVSLRWLVGRF
jgi:hypothetical protein